MPRKRKKAEKRATDIKQDLLRQEIDNCILLASYISTLIAKKQVANNNKPLIGIFFRNKINPLI